jgi:phosphate-selective porin
MCVRPAVLSFLVAFLSIPVAASAQGTYSPGTPIRIGNVLLSGYIQYDYVTALSEVPQRTDTFRFRRVRLTLTGPLGEDIDWGVQAEVTVSPNLRDAYIILKYVPAATVLIGQTVMPYGLERYVFSSNRLPFTERGVNNLAPGRDAGIMVYNARPFFGWLSYAGAVVNGTGQNTTDNNSAKDMMMRVSLAPSRVPGFSIGVNGATGEQPDGRRSRAGADLWYESRRYHAAVEFLRETNDRPSAPPRQNGFYAQGAWRAYPNAPRRGFDHLELGARYARIDGAVPEVNQVDLAVNYYAHRNLRFMFDVIVPADPAPTEPRATLHARVNIIF